MRCIAGALALMMAVSLHAAPEDVLAPEYAREEGWQWYNPNTEETEPEPAVPTLRERLASMTPSEQKKVLQQATREALDTAILYPSAENFRRFMTLQNFWTDRATDFTQTAKLARLKYPELDYNVKRSHYNGTVEARLTEEKKVQSAVISQVAQRYGLFFFYRGNNAVDNLMVGVIRAFCEDRGISLMASAWTVNSATSCRKAVLTADRLKKCVSPTSRLRFWSTRKLTSGNPLHGGL